MFIVVENDGMRLVKGMISFIVFIITNLNKIVAYAPAAQHSSYFLKVITIKINVTIHICLLSVGSIAIENDKPVYY